MAEWVSYSLSDFLLFAPETYVRLFERYNEALWPAQLLLLPFYGLVIWALLRGRGRLLLGLMTLAWWVVAWAFFWERYQQINWAATWMAGGFALQGLLLVAVAAWPRPLLRPRPEPLAMGLFLFALLLQPLIDPLAGAPWSAVGLAGLAPDPTAVATLALFLTLRGAARWLLLPLPLAWCLVASATTWGLDWPAGLIGPAVALLSLLVGAVLPRRT
ncbi:MAG: hypothetical protein Kilf2KO_12630 [Rhodospirillales bacterium]